MSKVPPKIQNTWDWAFEQLQDAAEKKHEAVMEVPETCESQQQEKYYQGCADTLRKVLILLNEDSDVWNENWNTWMAVAAGSSNATRELEDEGLIES